MLFPDRTVGFFKFLMTAFLAAKLLGWKVSVKGIRSSLSEADGSKADTVLCLSVNSHYCCLQR